MQAFNAVQWVLESNFNPEELSNAYPVSYRYCNLKEGKTLTDAYINLSNQMKISHEAGIKNSARLIRPSNGAPPNWLVMILYYPMALLNGRNGAKQLTIIGQM